MNLVVAVLDNPLRQLGLAVKLPIAPHKILPQQKMRLYPTISFC
jgi:hypothetical protein